MIALAAIVAVSVLVVLALRFPSPPTAPYNTKTTQTKPKTSPATTAPANTTTGPASSATGSHKASFHVVLTLSAATWVEATIGSPHGKAVIAQGGLNLGSQGVTIDPTTDPTVAFTSRKPVYLALGAPGNVSLRIDGRRVVLPHVPAGHRIRLDAAGARTA
jgi:hypothetical protein